MEKIIVDTGEYLSAILVGARWEAVQKLLPENDVVIITDDNVYNIYGSAFPGFPVFKVRPGEKSKDLKVIERLTKELLNSGFDRSGFILAIGGGVVCDLAGFLASVYMRGVKVGYISTTLLSQVDASTGGKTGVNVGKIKNVIGTFRQPEFVICDTAMLSTLTQHEYLSGLSELIKTAIIGNSDLFRILEDNFTEVVNRDRELLTKLISIAVKFKASVVAKDEKESGLRRILNFGHTYGHAIELYSGVPHGFAVAAGMELATEFSLFKEHIDKTEAARIIELIKRYNIIPDYKIPHSSVAKLILHDKKKSGSFINFVFTCGIGKAMTEKVSVKELQKFYKSFISKD